MNSKISKGLLVNKLEYTSYEVLKLKSQKARDKVTGKFVVEMAQGIELLMLINKCFVPKRHDRHFAAKRFLCLDSLTSLMIKGR